MAIAVAFLVCSLSLWRGFQGQTFMGRPLGGDFAQFYVVGEILNQYEGARIYDLDLEVELQHQSAPGTSKDQMLVFASAPYVGQIYRPFALLPYRWAYIAWLIFSLALYSISIVLLLRSTNLSRKQMKTGFLLGISSMPFLMETWIGGQIAVLGFFAIALFVLWRARNRRFLAGLALALAVFKPTLIAIPVLMLIVGRRWRMLSGVLTGVAALALVSTASVGMKGCVAWLDTVNFYGHLATGPVAALRRAKYIDVGSFFHLILGDSSRLAQLLGTVAGIAGVAILAFAWWRSSYWSAASRDLLWAATLAGALVCNVYTPIYDGILAGAAVVLVAGVILKRGSEDGEAFGAWLVLLYIMPWVTQSFAEFLRFQPFTLVLAAFAWWALRLAWRGEYPMQSCVQGDDSTRSEPCRTSQTEYSTYYQLLGPTSYAVFCHTSNSPLCLSVLPRSYAGAGTPNMGTG